MKFGKQIQKKQLEIPEYASSFVDYKGLKKLIKELKSSPVTRPDVHPSDAMVPDDPQSVLRDNKAPFFFRLDRELDKVNAFYTVKEAESKVRLRVLIDKQKTMRMRHPVISKTSTNYIALDQSLRDFIKDLSKLQQFIEINATAFSKILKKWDKTSKSQTKALYLSRAVEVQPCFNHDVISELSDQANTSLLDCAAWAEGEATTYGNSVAAEQGQSTPRLEQDEADSDALDALNRGDIHALSGIIANLRNSSEAGDRLTKAFIAAVSSAPEQGLQLVLDTGLVDFNRRDEINDRNCLHKTAMTGRRQFLQSALAAGIDPLQIDAYGRIPLHYACMNGHVELVQDLLVANSTTIDVQDLDNFTGLIHAIVRGHLSVVEKLLAHGAKVDAIHVADHIPLNLACQHGTLPIVELLLQHHPELIPDAEGLYPQHLVARFGQDPRIFTVLKDHGANLDQQDKLYSWTPLFHAAGEGRVKCLTTLLDLGANPRAVDEKGLSPQYYATWEGHLECMETLAAVVDNAKPKARKPFPLGPTPAQPFRPGENDIEQIPDLSLPPPIIPTRRYGHNFLQNKTTVVISFEDLGRKAVAFYDESKYPAARLTIAPRSSDILSRNILLPIQDENKNVSFETDALELFSVDFDVYPTCGKKVVAKGSVPSEVFQNRSRSSGYHYVSLLDPRLRSVGQIYFKYQVIQPFSGLPLDITPFATYWKATSQVESQPSSLVTGSSLTGEYVRLYVQLSRDGVPILYPKWTFDCGGVNVPVIGISYAQFSTLGPAVAKRKQLLFEALQANHLSGWNQLSLLHHALARAQISVDEALVKLPTEINVELHVLYPTEQEEERARLGPTTNINDFADNLLNVIFEHARRSRKESGNTMRSIVFTSYNRDLCTALNWKQPNYPVLLCNDLGIQTEHKMPLGDRIISDGGSAMSIKEAVRISQLNNFMGLVCRSRILDTIPTLVESIKVAGLVLVSDASDAPDGAASNIAWPAFSGVPDGVVGILKGNGVMRFNESIDT